MRVGVDQYTLKHLDGVRGSALLDLVRAHGLDGCQFRDPHEVSPTLDPAELRDVRAHARAHGMYLEVGISCPNPHAPGPVALQDGGGDLRAGLRRQLEAVAAAAEGTRSVRCFVGSRGARHRHPVPWPRQVADTIAVARDLTPILRDLGLKLAFENHAEASTFDLVRIAETLGSDVAGITLDTGNIAITVEDPLLAVQRAAPYTIATHVKDGIVVFADDGLVYNPRACGDGVVPIPEILQTLSATAPDLTVSIEDHGGLYEIPIFEDEFVATLPDLQPREMGRVVRLARECERRIAAGTLDSLEAAERTPWEARVFPRLDRAAAYVRAVVGRLESPARG